jgi:microcystin degradation protein MlrC
MGDNPTAGGSGDVTWTLNKILRDKKLNQVGGPEIIYASIPGPDLIKNALNTKIGDNVSGYVGAVYDDRFSPPILLKGILKSVKMGDINADAEVVVKVNNINVIVTNRRKPYHYISDFENLNLKPKSTDILIVKIGYLVPELYDIRGDWVMALTPGGVDQDLFRLDYKEIVRPIFPLDTNIENPDLSAKLIPKSN